MMVFDLNDSIAVEVIQTYLECARAQGKVIGLTSGTFDLLHFHHILYFTRCRRACDVLIVGVDSDRLVRKRKGEGRPLTYDSRRVAMVDAIKPVAFAFVMDDLEDFGRVAQITMPNVILKSDSFEGHEQIVVGRQYAGAIEIIRDVVDHSSTTQILEEAARISSRGK
jgi:D-beta-D-heptose 7-phosphate kinase/D-beta-D-heptose 1-phosphate adenosyltransferase